MERLYINITSKCNYFCPFCCMSSSPLRKEEMTFDKFKEIVDGYDGKDIEIQIEGGEPTIHPAFWLFVEYSFFKNNVSRVIVDTNGHNLYKIIDHFVEISERHGKKLTIKASDNHYIREKRGTKIVDEYISLISALEFVENVELLINLRGYTESEVAEMKNNYKTQTKDFTPFVNGFTFNRYGRLKNDKRLPEIIINRTVDTFHCYDSEGNYYGENLYKRAEHEEK